MCIFCDIVEGKIPSSVIYEDDQVMAFLDISQVTRGHTLVIIEHNMDIIKYADHVIDMGPEGGDGGGTVIAQGTPEEVAQIPESYTGQYVKKYLEK